LVTDPAATFRRKEALQVSVRLSTREDGIRALQRATLSQDDGETILAARCIHAPPHIAHQQTVFEGRTATAHLIAGVVKSPSGIA
jgi:hypothetical protein